MLCRAMSFIYITEQHSIEKLSGSKRLHPGTFLGNGVTLEGGAIFSLNKHCKNLAAEAIFKFQTIKFQMSKLPLESTKYLRLHASNGAKITKTQTPLVRFA